jgi:hypothetical protein
MQMTWKANITLCAGAALMLNVGAPGAAEAQQKTLDLVKQRDQLICALLRCQCVKATING